LLDENKENEENRVSFIENADDKIENLDELDYKILELLVLDSRIKTLEISKKLNSNVNTINSRIKKMKKSGVIHIFTINFEYPKINYKLYKVDIVLKDPKKAQTINNFLEKNPNLESIIKSLGYVDLEYVFTLNNVNQLHDIIADISKRFPDSIKNYKYFSITNTHKYEDIFVKDIRV
jgi:Lrp/AsnC family transcriptional regulator for asnA, asnC and gidA